MATLREAILADVMKTLQQESITVLREVHPFQINQYFEENLQVILDYAMMHDGELYAAKLLLYRMSDYTFLGNVVNEYPGSWNDYRDGTWQPVYEQKTVKCYTDATRAWLNAQMRKLVPKIREKIWDPSTPLGQSLFRQGQEHWNSSLA